MNAFLYTLEVNGYHQLFGCQHSSKYLILCSKERNSFFFLLSTIFYYFFFFFTQHNIQNKTEQNSRHILNISRFNQKGGREGRTTKNTKLLLKIITYIQPKNTAKPQWLKAWPHRLALLYTHMTQFAGGCGSNMPLYTCVV